MCMGCFDLAHTDPGSDSVQAIPYVLSSVAKCMLVVRTGFSVGGTWCGRVLDRGVFHGIPPIAR